MALKRINKELTDLGRYVLFFLIFCRLHVLVVCCLSAAHCGSGAGHAMSLISTPLFFTFSAYFYIASND